VRRPALADRAGPPLCEDGKVGDGHGVTGDGEVRLAGPGRLEAGYARGTGWRAAVEQDQRGDVHGRTAISARTVLASSELSRSSRRGCRLCPPSHQCQPRRDRAVGPERPGGRFPASPPRRPDPRSVPGPSAKQKSRSASWSIVFTRNNTYHGGA